MQEVFAVLLDEFRDLTLNDSIVLENIGRQIHAVTGGQMREFAGRLDRAALRPLTIDQILMWADLHFDRTGDWPIVKSGPIIEAPEESWANINANLERGHRGLASISTDPVSASIKRLKRQKRWVFHSQC